MEKEKEQDLLRFGRQNRSKKMRSRGVGESVVNMLGDSGTNVPKPFEVQKTTLSLPLGRSLLKLSCSVQVGF